MRLLRIGREAGPQHEAIGLRIAGRDAERERIVGEGQLRALRDLRPQAAGDDERGGNETTEEGAAGGDEDTHGDGLDRRCVASVAKRAYVGWI